VWQPGKISPGKRLEARKRGGILGAMSTVLPIWGAVLILCLSCLGVGSRLVTSRQPLVALLAGWSVFLALSCVPWFAGLSANAVRPLFWIFFGAGLWGIWRGRLWTEALITLLATAAVAFGLLHRCYAYEDGAKAFGAHGTDMWGYVGVAEWLYTHSTRELPVMGESPMRFTWTWYVLTTRERPLIYEALACLGASTGLDAVKAYMAWPVALMATLAIGLTRTAGMFGTRHWALALVPALVMVFHPLPVLHWIAGFAAGTIVGLLVGLAFAAVAVVESGPARTEAAALAVLTLVFCGGLYSPSFMLVGVGLAGALWASGGIAALWSRGWRAVLKDRPGLMTAGTLAVASVVAAATRGLSGDEVIGLSGFAWNRETLAQALGIFGLNSPYSWMFYRSMEPWDLDPWFNPVGLIASAGMLVLFLGAAWASWRGERDLRIPLLVAICVVGLVRVGGDERAVMSKAMPIFGVALIFLTAAISARLRPRWLGLLAAVLCVLPVVRSYDELRELIRDPYITVTDANITAGLEDGHNWRIMGYLYFREDSHGYVWADNPKFFFSMTCFLPKSDQAMLRQKHGLPPL